MMDSLIPFVASKEDRALAAELHGDSEVFRVPLHRLGRGSMASGNVPLWIDPCVDGYHHLLKEGDPWWDHEERDRAAADEAKRRHKGAAGKKRPKTAEEKLCAAQERRQRDPWRKHLKSYADCRVLAEATAVEGKGPTENRDRIEAFVSAVMDSCIEHAPAWLSVPQLPYVQGNHRNKINRELASAVATWRAGVDNASKLILPVVLTGRKLYQYKSERDSKIKTIADCYKRCSADGVWVVDSELRDQDGARSQTDRFGELVQFHEELNDELPGSPYRVAGPYWGMNLVLWARGLVDFPAIGVGKAYQYHVSGGLSHGALVRIALPPLRRWAPVGGAGGSDLRNWLDEALGVLSHSDDGHGALRTIRNDYGKLASREAAQRQIAAFYKEWFNATRDAGERAVALFQALSAAYVLGKRLPNLPTIKDMGREPGEIARQFMLNCL